MGSVHRPERRLATARHGHRLAIVATLAVGVLAAGRSAPLAAQTSAGSAPVEPAPPAAAAAPAAPADEETPSDPAYEQAITQAVAEFAAGRWEEARALFKRAHEIEPSARTLRGLGMTAFELRMYVTASRELDAALRDERKPLTDAQRQSVQALVDRANAFVGRYQLVLEPTHARPHVDGQPVQFEPGAVVLLDIGEHELRVSADGYVPVTRTVRVEGGQRVVLRVVLEPVTGATMPAAQAAPAAAAPAPAAAPAADEGGGGLRTAAWIVLGGAGVFGAAAGAFWIVGQGQYDDLEAACGDRGCTDAEIDDSGVKTSDLMTNVFIGLAAAAGATSVVLFVIDAGQDTPTESAGAELRLGPGALRITGRF